METAAGIYTRMMFADADSKSDPQLSGARRAMLDATPDCIKVVSVDGKLLMMNRAGCLALDVAENSGFGMPWLSLLPEDIRAAGEDALRKAAAGQAARFPGRSGSPNGTVYWDNLLTPLADASGKIVSILCVSRDVTEKTLLERQLEEALDREKLLAREMRHRIKNIFSVVLGLVSISKREAEATDNAETAIEILRDKLGALSRASDAVFAQENGVGTDADPIDIGTVVTSVMQPYGHRCTTAGATLSIRRDAITTFALFLHELATNSVKYGALSKGNGDITIHWVKGENSLDLTWSEIGGPTISSPPGRRGFGTEMVDRVVRSIGGTIDRTWRNEGLLVGLRFPGAVLG